MLAVHWGAIVNRGKDMIDTRMWWDCVCMYVGTEGGMAGWTERVVGWWNI